MFRFQNNILLPNPNAPSQGSNTRGFVYVSTALTTLRCSANSVGKREFIRIGTYADFWVRTWSDSTPLLAALHSARTLKAQCWCECCFTKLNSCQIKTGKAYSLVYLNLEWTWNRPLLYMITRCDEHAQNHSLIILWPIHGPRAGVPHAAAITALGQLSHLPPG